MKFSSKGGVHLHTTYSDGTGNIPQIACDAKKAGLDWIVITDHNNLAGLHNGEEGWHDGIAVIIGAEISPKNSDHYLALNIKKEIPASLSPEEIINEVKAQGGIGFVAHPDENACRKNSYPPLRWSDWNLRGFDGIEIWNYMSDWGDNYNPKFNIYNLFARHQMLKGPTNNVMKWWDELNQENNHVVPALGSLDAHAFKVSFLKVFPYHDTLKTITNYIFHEKELSLDFDETKKQVLTALKAGNNIIVNRIWTKGQDKFCFNVISGKQKTIAGGKTSLDDSSELMIKLPQKARIKLINNGNTVLEQETEFLEVKGLVPGKYRFEAYFKNKPWIFSNPIICE